MDSNNIGSPNVEGKIMFSNIGPNVEVKLKSVTGSRQVSNVWNYFTKKGVGKDSVSECKGCKRTYKSGGKYYGTSTLRRHMETCKQLICRDADGNLKDNKVNSRIAHELLATAIVKHDLPFSFVEYDGIRTFLRYVSPKLSLISRNTLVSDVNKLYLKEKTKLKEVLAKIQHRVCLTSDLWTACTSEGYICLTAHFVDDTWKLNSKILNFEHFPPPHTGMEMAKKILEFLKEWGIDKKIFSITLDNASSNDTMQTILKDHLSLNDNLMCGGDFFHIRCSAHVLNLVVQDGLKFGEKALNKIRESVKYVKSSESRMKIFEECIAGISDIDTSVGLRLDVSTRWNSTYLMLKSAIKYKKVFTSFRLKDSSYKWCPSTDDWKKCEKLCDFLEPFYDTTNLISGTSYPTSNLYFMQIWKIERLLKTNLLNVDPTISGMCVKMLEKFDKYWSEYSLVLAFGAVLDPRLKLKMLGYFYSKVEFDSTKCEEMMSLVKCKLYKLFEGYSNTTKSSASQSQSQSSLLASNSSDETSKNEQKLRDEMSAYESETMSSLGKSNLDVYLEEARTDHNLFKDLNVLEFWKEQRLRFPDLASMACDVLAIPITTVASESAFSIGGRVLTKYRSSMLPEKFQSLICTRNWLYGFASTDDYYASTTGTTSLSNESSSKVVENSDDELDDVEEDVEDDMEDDF